MGSIWHWLIVLVIVMVLFGRGRISEMMGDFGKGISSFKKGLNETDESAPKPSARIEAPAPVETPVAAPAPADKTES
jgi:sec-independent protein translocase protein TatA